MSTPFLSTPSFQMRPLNYAAIVGFDGSVGRYGTDTFPIESRVNVGLLCNVKSNKKYAYYSVIFW
jgi:hypothetical protein